MSLNAIISILEDDERQHAVLALRELAEAGERLAAARALRTFVVGPVNEWIADSADAARIDIAAGLQLANHAHDLAGRFEDDRIVVPEQLDRLDDLWRAFQAAAGYGAAALAVSNEAKQARWQTAGGKSRKGKVSPFKAAVLALAQRLGTRDAQAILDEMRADTCDESELLDDLRERRENPVMLRFQEVPEHAEDDEQILFVRTDNGEECARTVKTMKNYLS